MASKEQYQAYLTVPQVRAFLDTIAWAEGGLSYNTLFGGGTFSGSQHPNRAITAGGYTSTAAGRYQFIFSTWIEIKGRLGLADFSPANQDIAAVDLIAQRGQLSNLLAGNIEGVLRGLGCAWASLPFSGCHQREKTLDQVLRYYNSALAVYGGAAPAAASLPVSAGGSSQGELILAIAAVGLLALLWD